MRGAKMCDVFRSWVFTGVTENQFEEIGMTVSLAALRASPRPVKTSNDYG
jgi:hypothetical protein